MTRITPLAALTASFVAALALCAAAAAAGPTLGTGAGCSVACIESAVVTTTASSASVEVRTSVATSVSVTVTRLDAELGLTAGPRPKHVSVPAFLTVRTVQLAALEPATGYRIVVSARDVNGRVQSRAGTFTTGEVKVAVETPGVGLSAGPGCGADCLVQGTLASSAIVPGRATLRLRASVPATFDVQLVARSSAGKVLHQLTKATGSRKIAHTTTIDGLLTGTTYAVRAKATDAEGRTHVEEGTFRTRGAQAVVTLHRIDVLEDGDKGANRGELDFDLYVAGTWAYQSGFHRLGSGSTFAPREPGTSTPGVTVSAPVDGRRRLALLFGAAECDWQRLDRCPREAGGYDLSASAAASVDLRAAFLPGEAVLPPGHATGLPAGHDAYVVAEGRGGGVRFLAYATVDVWVAG